MFVHVHAYIDIQLSPCKLLVWPTSMSVYMFQQLPINTYLQYYLSIYIKCRAYKCL